MALLILAATVPMVAVPNKLPGFFKKSGLLDDWVMSANVNIKNQGFANGY
ncbi:hypothetical protein MiSe_47580 [Microseira wollei NIES-4236]|uniref:Uncharacterized protein n=1 Tax=Microseira wollei NIES-4236 TaxID=2530354 RepID=A0AAV3XIK9_9CYAN|nr:hypothetical protein MiSe_47580 [Microseira wollei NIES-4236]